MSRMVVILLGLSLAAGLAVALVQAQESSRQGTWNPPLTDSSTTTSNRRITLSNNAAPTRTAQPTNSTTVRPAGGLIDRLRAIRSGQYTAQRPNSESPAYTAPPSSPTSPVYQPTSSPAGGYPETQTENRLQPMVLDTPASQPQQGPPSYTAPGNFVMPEETQGSQADDYGASAGGHAGEGSNRLPSVLKRPGSQQEYAPAANVGTPRTARRTGDESRSSRRGAGGADFAPASPSETNLSPSASSRWQPNAASSRLQNDSSRMSQDTSRLSQDSSRLRHHWSGDQLVLSSLGPALKVETTGPKAVDIGREAAYSVSVSNLSDSEADNVMVMVDLPNWVQVVGGDASKGQTQRASETGAVGRLTWHVGSVGPRAAEELQLKLVPRERHPFELNVSWGFAPKPSAAQIEVQEPQLQVALEGPDNVPFGRPAVYTIVLSNPGTGAAQDVAVRLAPLIPGTTESGMQQVGTLGAGEKRELKIEVMPRQPGTMNVQVEAEAEGGLRSEAARQVHVRRAELQLAASGPGLKYAGSVASYQMSVVNTGDDVAENVRVDLALPNGAKYVGGLQQVQHSTGGLRWNVGRLPAGEQRNYEVQCELTSAGDLMLDVVAKADGDLSATAAVTTHVDAIADLKLEVNDPQGPRAVGANVLYEIKVINRGTKEARGVTVVMQFSEGIEPVSADGQQAEVVTGQVVFAPIERLEPGKEKTLKVTARSDRPGNHIFRAELRCADPEAHRVSEGTTRFFQAQR